MDEKNQSNVSETSLQTSSTSVPSSRNKSKKAIAQIVISALMLALALVIKGLSELFPFLNFPQGGSITIILVPLVLCGLYCGPIWGTLISIAFGLFDFLWDGAAGWFASTSAAVVCCLLDYVVAFGVIGLASIFRRSFFEKKPAQPVLGLILVGLLRFLSHLFSGIIVFNQIANYNDDGLLTALTPNWTSGGFVYSFSYNGAYMFPTIALSALVLAIIMKPLYSTFHLPYIKVLEPKNLEVNQDINFTTESIFDSLLPYLEGMFALLGVSSLIPDSGKLPDHYVTVMANLGYVSLLLMACVDIYLFIAFYNAIKNKKEEKKTYVLYLLLSLFVFGISILGIVSQYTFGAPIPEEA